MLSMKMMLDPISNLILPVKFYEEKNSLKKSIESIVDKVLREVKNQDTYYINLHAKFNPNDPSEFMMDTPRITLRLPPFTSNQLVYWVDPKKGICELLWMVAPKKKGEKLHVEFNTKGVAYLQAKSAMPS